MRMIGLLVKIVFKFNRWFKMLTTNEANDIWQIVEGFAEILMDDRSVEEVRGLVLENTAVNATGGAGIQAGQMLIDEGIKTVITGNLGLNVSRVLATGNIETFSAEGRVIDALKMLKDKKLPKITDHSVPGHFGMGAGMGRGGGRGGGRDGGRGR